MTTEQKLREALQTAIWRIEDMLKGDDGQAWKEAEKALPGLRQALALPTTEPVEGGEVVGMKRRLVQIHDALGSDLGDTDPDIPEDMTDDEIREYHPVFWAAKEIASLIGDGSWDRYTTPPASQEQAQQPTTQAQEPAACDGGTCGIGGYCNDCTQPQAQELPDERALPTLIGAHPDWDELWNIDECVRLARIWTGYIDITKPDDHENYVPQWHVVMAVLLHAALTTGPQPATTEADGATTGAALAAKPVPDDVRKDAQRYRWLADCLNYPEAVTLISDGSLTADALGKAIDTAMRKEKP